MAALRIALKDLKLRVRDRSAIIQGFVAPLLLATIFTLAFGGGGDFRATFGIVDLDGERIPAAFAEIVNTLPGEVEIKKLVTEADAARLTSSESISAAFVFPRGFTSAIESGKRAKIKVIRRGESISGEIAAAIAQGFTDEVNSGFLAVRTAARAGATRGISIQTLIAKAGEQRLPITLRDELSGGSGKAASSYFGPSMATFFLFFTVSFGVLGIMEERQNGTLQRLLVKPISRSTVVLGKVLASLVIGLTSLAMLIVATTYLLRISWGDPIGVAALCISITLAATAIAGLAMTFARNVEHATGLTSIVAVVLALLGGNFIPLAQAPEIFQLTALFTPNGWAMRGFLDLIADGGGLETVTGPVGAILAFALVLGIAAMMRGKKLVVG